MDLLAELEAQLSADSPDGLPRRRALLREIVEAFQQGGEPRVTALLAQRAAAFERESGTLIKALQRYLQGGTP
jgi:hypothetical protein